MKLFDWLFPKKIKHNESIDAMREPVNARRVNELLGEVALLTQEQIADFVVFGHPPPEPIKKLCDAGAGVIPLVTNELKRILAQPGGADISVISLAFILCRIGTRECVEGILQIMDYSTFVLFSLNKDGESSTLDPFEWLYDLCAATIGRVGDKSVAQDLVRMIQDPQKDQVRPSACMAVGLLRAAEARPALTAALKDNNMDTGSRVREAAAQALKSLDRTV